MGAPDVVVVGGGVIGQAIAWQAARQGLSVTVVDPEPGRGASWAAAGMLAPVSEAAFREEALLRANLESHRRWPAFAGALEEAAGAPIGYRECGTVAVARDGDEAAEVDRLVAFRQELGLGVSRLRGSELRRLEPGLATGVRAGALCPGDHQVDNRAVVTALSLAGRREGVTFVGDAVTGVRDAAGRVTGVELHRGGTLVAGSVVIAAGAASGRIEGLDPALARVRPVKGQLLHLRVPAGMPPLHERTIRGLDAYIVSRGDGRMVVGATMEEQGFDRTVTAGAVYELLRAAYELLPGIAECRLEETIAGLRPATPDNGPLVGPAGAEGLLLATGHYRHGMLLAPLTADGVVRWLASGTLPETLVPFAPQRFAEAEVGV